MSSGVADRVIIVTGGGGSIGRGVVRYLGSHGAKVVVAEVDPVALEATVDELTAAGVDCLGTRTDVTRRPDIDAMVDATVARFGRVDGLLNNAWATSGQHALVDITDEMLDAALTGLVKATLWGMQAVYPHMKAAGWGRIVNVGSGAGLLGFKGYGAYAAGKEAVRALTRVAAREWAADGIVVNCHCPVSLPRLPDGPAQDFIGESMRILASLVPDPSSEPIGDPEHDLAPTVAFLLSDECRYLTGQTLTLDGGAYASA